ncbi:hypothetical protein FSOLCH5_15539 [Fusarium solani]
MAAEAATRVTVESIRESPSKPSWTELERKTKCLSARCVRAWLGGGFGASREGVSSEGDVSVHTMPRQLEPLPSNTLRVR